MEAAGGVTRWTLMLTTVPEVGVPWRRFVLHPDQRTVVGGTGASDLVVEGPAISSRHVTFWFEDGYWMVEDMGSTSGTIVDEQHIGAPTRLAPGCTLRVGGVELIVTYRGPDERASLPRGATAAEKPPEPVFPATPVHETYAVWLPDGAVWWVAHRDYVALVEPMFAAARPFWPPGKEGEIDLREATRDQVVRLLDTAESEGRRARLGPSTWTGAMKELVRLLSSDRRLLSYRSAPPRTEEAIRAERTRAEYAVVHFRAEVRMHRGEQWFRPTAAIHVELPEGLGSGYRMDCFFAAHKLEEMKRPSQSEIDRVAALLAGEVEDHVVRALRGDGAAKWGPTWSTEGHSGLPLLVKAFVARYQPSEPVANRLRLAIFVMSEALKRSVHFYGPVEEFQYQNMTVWFEHFHDMAQDLGAGRTALARGN